MTMTHDQAVDILAEAADSWASELEMGPDATQTPFVEKIRTAIKTVESHGPLFSDPIDVAVTESVTAQLRIVKELGGDPIAVVAEALKNHGLYGELVRKARDYL